MMRIEAMIKMTSGAIRNVVEVNV